MKPVSFGQVFVVVFILGFLILLVLGRVTRMPEDEILIPSIVCGVIALFIAYAYRGDTLVRRCEDQKKLLHNLTVRLTENRYILESQTGSVLTLKLPGDVGWGRVYIFLEGEEVRVVGPARVLQKLRDV